ncbi:uncharacterized protein SCHCODRAFT_02244880 [Schizophyllum commune H4-8]|uniref:uncharacterized protein n=1 Tax=Schizophyllum commune (strain H4-8 / FGSC 9210) TaxID=578458 RepID=UPI00215E13BB|nr:uncharacterized protein SCHCODRAFT_02244880 [Schizophyllum commune H4-8]KAI5893092.1 hypothetical protein SCHCODRAFT_02244880 [Schizophyllum commune H4-8]
MGDQANLQYIPDMVRESHLDQCDAQDENSSNASPTLVATPSSNDMVQLAQKDDDVNHTLVEPSWAPYKNEDAPPLNAAYRHFKDPVLYAIWQTPQVEISDRENAYLAQSGGKCSRTADLRYSSQGQDCSGVKRRRAPSLDGFGL